MNRERSITALKALERFVSLSFGLGSNPTMLSSEIINANLLSACAYNTYVETLSNKSDTILRYSRENDKTNFTYAYLDFVAKTSKRINLNQKPVVLAFDYTKETFWGEVEGLDIIGTKKTEKGTGAFKFLTCSQVSGKIYPKFPLISIPVQLGQNKSHVITYCISLIKKYVGEIEIILFDREFYNKELMMTLNHLNLPYLIFVPKKKGEISDTLDYMYNGEMIAKTHYFDVNKDKTVLHDETTMLFLKEIFDGKSYEHYDWCFVTNLRDFSIENSISTYKCRWRIETGFRVQDEADSKTKSTIMKTRYFFFLYEQLLQSIWYVFFKQEEEVSFKQFIITLHNLAQEIVQPDGSKVHIKSHI
jgi:hypothetical protein